MPPFTLHPSPFTLLSSWSSPHPSDLSLAIARRREANLPVIDLITANPHEHGIICDPALVERAMMEGLRTSAVYRPDARGQRPAREAIAEWHKPGTSPDNIILTPGTSLAYLYAFRLLAERGEVLCPTPTYPLFDDLARIAGCTVRRYHLTCSNGRWSIDPDEIAFQITPATRVLVLVSPHNPTGHVVSREEMRAIADIAIVFDEVFRDVLHGVDEVPRPSDYYAPLTLTLNGLSKRLALPGLKAGWIVVEGDPEKGSQLLNALEYFSDTLLPVNEAVQEALPILLRDGEPEVQRIAAILRARMREVIAAAQLAHIPTTEPDGGIYTLFPIPLTAAQTNEQLAIQLLERAGLLLHPGSLYGIEQPHLVATIINNSTPQHLRNIATLQGHQATETLSPN